ncbi:hypothetical protein B0I35DRAFT_484127 [Stachybotrys elegans]|uniref:Uncharacterized protein n=1 Tax=Stachybotrys elegans TaxID=80388 RepID=A0A8K0WJX3_9HYPO|nr:hypothetical protein B0I35DRAFT_484127 [Stachybotrys elegans]
MDFGNKQQKDEGEKVFKIQPIEAETEKASKLNPFSSKGPAVQQDMPQQEGTKAERLAKKEAMNSK